MGSASPTPRAMKAAISAHVHGANARGVARRLLASKRLAVHRPRIANSLAPTTKGTNPARKGAARQHQAGATQKGWEPGARLVDSGRRMSG